MTSASELFHNRRLRFGRNSDAIGVGIDLDSPSPVDRSSRRHRHYQNSGSNQTRRDRVCDPLRRPPQPSGQSVFRRNSHSFQERESIRPEGGIHPYPSGSDSHSESHVSARDYLRNHGNDRLPGAVLLARERLLQRLRGVTLSTSRRNDRHASGNDHNSSGGLHNIDMPIEDEFRLLDAGDWETEISREWLAAIDPLTNSTGQQWKKRPPGLTQETLSSLQVEVFCEQEEISAPGLPKALNECSICLESFSSGDELISLPCGHRYHFYCLYPWVRTCGDCPYCRRSIDTTTKNRES